MFKELIADLNGLAAKNAPDLSKSQAGDAADANIQAAGATGGDSGDGGEGAASNADADGGDGEGDGEEGDLAKSFEVTLEGGKKFQAIDASDLLKSLNARIEDIEKGTGEALGAVTLLIKSLVAQNAQLTEAIQKMGTTGAGRKAVVTLVGKTTPAEGGTLAKGAHGQGGEQTMKPQEFLLKSENAFEAGAITGRELSLIETHINRAEAIPAPLIQKVVNAKAKA